MKLILQYYNGCKYTAYIFSLKIKRQNVKMTVTVTC